jgi:hypothetical protein
MEEQMKSAQHFLLAGLMAVTGTVFAAAHTAAPGTTSMAPAAAPTMAPGAVSPMAPSTNSAMKMTHAQRKAAKKQIDADEKMAKAECKKLSGSEKRACKKEAEAKEKIAEADLKAK